MLTTEPDSGGSKQIHKRKEDCIKLTVEILATFCNTPCVTIALPSLFELPGELYLSSKHTSTTPVNQITASGLETVFKGQQELGPSVGFPGLLWPLVEDRSILARSRLGDSRRVGGGWTLRTYNAIESKTCIFFKRVDLCRLQINCNSWGPPGD